MSTTAPTSRDGLAPPSFDRAYWLAHCEGFRVETTNGRLGFVEEVRPGAKSDDDAIVVRAGRLGRRVLLVSPREVEFIVPRAQRLWLHSPPRLTGTEPA